MTTKAEKRRARLDIIVLCTLPILAAVASIFLDINFLTSIILFFGLPATYLSFRTPNAIARSLLFSLVTLIAIAFIEYYAGVDKSWYVHSIFPRVFDHIAIEDLVWGFLLTYFIVMFYEHFFDKGRHKVVGVGLKYFALMLAGVFSVLFTLHFMDPKNIEFFYFRAGLILLLLPVISVLIIFPKYISVLLKITPYFFGLGLIVALTSIQNGYWYYPGENFIGWVSIGSYRFPIEELIFWMTLLSSAIIVYFEFFDDNRARLPQKAYRKIMKNL
jgi:hypothetical protein